MAHFQEKKIIFLSVSATLLLLLLVFIVILPGYNKITTTNKQIYEMRTQLETKYLEAKLIHKSQIKIDEAEKLMQTLEKNFLPKGNELTLITFLENLSEKNSLKQVLTLNPEKLMDKFNYPYLELNAVLTGELSSLMIYLDEIAKSNYYIYVTDLNFVKGGSIELATQQKVLNPVTLNIKALVYVQN